MDMSQVEKIDEYCWTLSSKMETTPVPVRLYGNEALLNTMDDKVLEQIINVAKLPGIVVAAMTMPDAHWGYGFPIGGVAAFDPNLGGIISAGGVGFDISCGIRCLRTDLNWDELYSKRVDLGEILFRMIPAGVGKEGRLKLAPQEINEVLEGGARWAVDQGYGLKEDLEYVEERGQMAGAVPESVSDLAKKRQRGEMGTLGSGNHYLEIQVVDRIHDQQAADAYGLKEGQVIVSIHCGSRGLGHQIGTDYLLSLAKEAGRLGITLPDREPACAPILSPEGEKYIGAMRAGINCALGNRQILTHLTRIAFEKILPNTTIETLFDVSHNTCKTETHKVNGEARELYIHRKGATRAFGPGHPTLPKRYQQVGQPVIIGGSMGTRSYILAGNPESQNKAFASASHGAGRSMSRHQALKHWRGSELIDSLGNQGIIIRTRSLRGAAEEAPGAYKDVDQVAEATEKAGLARRVVSLRPKVCVKG